MNIHRFFTLSWAVFLFLSGNLCVEAEQGVFAHWRMEPRRLLHKELTPLQGPWKARLESPASMMRDLEPTYVEFFEHAGGLSVSDDLPSLGLPTAEITVEAWARVDKPQEWGGLVSALQDNGSFERGWSLGFRNNHFGFALASEENQRLEYLTSSEPFEARRWYHVVGVYDGASQSVYVNGRQVASYAGHSGPISYPPTGYVEIGAYRDDNEHYRLSGAVSEVLVYSRALSVEEILGQYQKRAEEFPEPKPEPELLAIPFGPFIEVDTPTSVSLRWEADFESEIEFVYWPKNRRNEKQTRLSMRDGKRHSLSLRGLDDNQEYRFQIQSSSTSGLQWMTKEYEFDTSYYYDTPDGGSEESPYPEDRYSEIYRQAAEKALAGIGVNYGYCIVLDSGEGRLAYELAKRSRLKVIGLETDPELRRRSREMLDQAGLYGLRVSVIDSTLEEAEFGPYFANLIISDQGIREGLGLELAPELALHSLRPNGGVLFSRTGDGASGQKMDGFWGALEGCQVEKERDRDATWVVAKRRALAGAGDWTHQYGDAANTSCSEDELVQGEMSVLWWGEPGPRPMPDRGPRNPAPLSSNGRMYVQGNRTLFGLDAYNGSILWSLTNPEMRRANMPRDCSNMVASEEGLYLAQGRYCMLLEGGTGERVQRFMANAHTASDPYDWGYLSVQDRLLIGSSVRARGAYLGDDGEWYEHYDFDQTSRVVSRDLFAIDRFTGDLSFVYEGGAILNSTITIDGSTIYFIESSDPDNLRLSDGRAPIEKLPEQRLVALDLHSGELLWERAFDFGSTQFMTYLVSSNGTIVVTGTDKNKVYHTFAFDSGRSSDGGAAQESPEILEPGRLLWQDSHKEDKGHHSGHLQHPVVIGDVFYSDQRSFDLRTGETLRTDLPERRGCGTMSASQNSMFFRHYFHGMWDLNTDERTQFEGIRGGCWLGLIPAGGLLLAPETSAGCSCTHSIQTTVAYAPVSSMSATR